MTLAFGSSEEVNACELEVVIKPFYKVDGAIPIVRRLLETMTGGRIELEPMGERRAQRGWLRGRFQLDLIASITNQNDLGISVSAPVLVEMAIDRRPPMPNTEILYLFRWITSRTRNYSALRR